MGEKNIKKTRRIILVLFAALMISGCSLMISEEEQKEIDNLNSRISVEMKSDLNSLNEMELLTRKENLQEIQEQYSRLQQKQKDEIENYDFVGGQITAIDKRIETIKQEEVQNVVDLINSMGTVTLDSNSKIADIKEAYGSLDDAQKQQVTNYNQVAGFETKYNELRVDEVKNAIKKIGKVTLENGAKNRIDEAKKLYKNLPSGLKGKVSNYKTITKKNKKYKKLLDYKDYLLYAKSAMNSGHLNEAKGYLDKVPYRFKYKKTKASVLKNRLRANSRWLAVCGTWTTTGGRMDVEQIWDYDESSESWYRDFS